jgi:hypothetical protein
MTFESDNHSRSIFGSSRSDHTLNHIIYHQPTILLKEVRGLTSKRIISEPNDISVHLLKQIPSLFRGEAFESLLQNPTSVGVGSKFSNVVREGLGDKVWASVEGDQSLDISSSLLRLGGVVAYLNDVVTVVIFDAIDDSAIEFSDESIPLILQYMLESLLDHLILAHRFH